VDFDPVHARLTCKSDEELEVAARELGISKEVLELFPIEFEESELGMIPKGWEWKKFGDILIPKKGKNITKDTITDGSVPVVAGGLTPAYYHSEYNVKAPVITVSASGANAGYVNLYTQNIWASDCSYINEGMTKFVYSMYLFLKENQKEITRMQQGAAQPHVYPKDLMRLVIANPNQNLWTYIEELIEPMFKQVGNNAKEIEVLQKTRDTLLPKLLSGELDVSEIAL
jgi:type I restriction enzyme S subunit